MTPGNWIAAAAVALTFLIWADSKNFWRSGSLTYETQGLECDGRSCQLRIFVRNNGYASDDEVRFELPGLLEHTQIFASSAYEVSKLGQRTVLKIGTLHPAAIKLVSIDYPPDSKLTPLELEHLDISSKQRMAEYAGPDGPYAAPKFPWWLEWFLVGYLALLGLGILARVFETKTAKLKRLGEGLAVKEKSVSKYKERIAELEASMRPNADASPEAPPASSPPPNSPS